MPFTTNSYGYQLIKLMIFKYIRHNVLHQHKIVEQPLFRSVISAIVKKNVCNVRSNFRWFVTLEHHLWLGIFGSSPCEASVWLTPSEPIISSAVVLLLRRYLSVSGRKQPEMDWVSELPEASARSPDPNFGLKRLDLEPDFCLLYQWRADFASKP